MAGTVIMTRICISPYPSPYPIKKIQDSPYPYSFPVNARLSVKTETGSSNTRMDEFICHLQYKPSKQCVGPWDIEIFFIFSISQNKGDHRDLGTLGHSFSQKRIQKNIKSSFFNIDNLHYLTKEFKHLFRLRFNPKSLRFRKESKGNYVTTSQVAFKGHTKQSFVMELCICAFSYFINQWVMSYYGPFESKVAQSYERNKLFSVVWLREKWKFNCEGIFFFIFLNIIKQCG